MPEPTIDQILRAALQHHQSGQLSQAESLYQQILALQPNHPDVLHNLGLIAAASGRNDQALALIGKAIAIHPSYAVAHYNRGNILKSIRQLPDAIAAYRQAITLNPGLAEAYNNLGDALRESGQFAEAAAACRQAIALNAANPRAHNNLGVVLRDEGRIDEAIAAFQQALTLRPNYPEAHSNLGVALQYRGRRDEAIAAIRRAIALNPNNPEFHCNLGAVLKQAREPEQAIAAYRQAIALRPNYPLAYSNLGAALKDIGFLDEALAAYRQAIALRPDYLEAHSNLLFALHFPPNQDFAAIAEEHRAWNRLHAEPLRQFIPPHHNDRSPGRRLRIGYVSPDFHDHPVGRFILSLLANHDKNSVEVFAYAQVRTPDAMTRELQSHADHWHSLVGLSDAQAAELIHRHEIDILVDLAGHTAQHRLLVFARKPAPIQVTYLGATSTTGLAVMDYRITDAYADPPSADPSGSTEHFQSEQLIRLAPCGWCFQSQERPPVTERPEGRPITFGCFNNFAKVTAPMLQLWRRILHAVPESRLIMKAAGLGSESVRQRIRQSLAGIDPARLELRGPEPTQGIHLALYDRMDIALDTFPYDGHTTTCEALWMGVPVVTLAGSMAVSRVGVSLLTNVGFPEWVANSEEEYLQIAVRLAGDPTHLRQLRASLRQRMEQSPLMNAPQFTKNVEAAYRQIWHKWCAEPKE